MEESLNTQKINLAPNFYNKVFQFLKHEHTYSSDRNAIEKVVNIKKNLKPSIPPQNAFYIRNKKGKACVCWFFGTVVGTKK